MDHLMDKEMEKAFTVLLFNVGYILYLYYDFNIFYVIFLHKSL